METEELIEDAKYYRDLGGKGAPDAGTSLRYLEIAKADALIAIAQELKRANDAHDTEIEWLENERQGLNG